MTVRFRSTRAEIDLEAIAANADRLVALGGVPVWAVIKADAYGHGAVAVARSLAGRHGIRGLAVSLVEEGVELREAGISAPILVMGPTLAGGYRELAARQLTPMVSQLGDLEALAALDEPPPIHLKIDTGMGRIGLLPEELDRALATRLEIAGVATHLACADEDDPDDADSLSRRQLIRFATACARVKRRSASVERHAANSSGLVKLSASRLDVTRPGIALYGNGLARDRARVAQGMHFVTEVAQVRTVRAGGTVSYGAIWRAERDSRIAVLPVGYADGYPRRLTRKASVKIGNTRYPVVGTVCMDMIMVDVTDADLPVRPGDEVTLLGGAGEQRITAGEFAGWAGVSEYEVTCGISKRVPRRYR